MSATSACLNMIKQQLRTNNILSEKVLSLFIEPTRQKFIPEGYQDFAYADMQIPLNHKQTMLTPLEEAKILETGKFNGSEKVLEIGTGTGYLSYLLSQVCKQIISIDCYKDFIENAANLHKKLKVKNVELMEQDATQITKFPFEFDAIICTSGLEFIPEHWLKLLKPEGKIFAPIGEITQNCQWLHTKDQKVVGHEFVFQSTLPMLINHQRAKFIF
jgi:protein-L-isoaspartate(D-aspartate) O-methyltransferase